MIGVCSIINYIIILSILWLSFNYYFSNVSVILQPKINDPPSPINTTTKSNDVDWGSLSAVKAAYVPYPVHQRVIKPKNINIEVAAINTMISQYHAKHSINTITVDNVCSRRYVYPERSDMGKCTSIGNRVGDIANDFAWAMILDRTFIISWSARNCSDTFLLQAWVPHIDDVRIIAKQAGCDDIFNNNLFVRNTPRVSFPIGCCNIDDIQNRIITFKSFLYTANQELTPLLMMNTSSSWRGGLSTASYHRAAVLFPRDMNVHASYGMLSESLFDFSDTVKAHTISMISTQEKDAAMIKTSSASLSISSSPSSSNQVRLGVHLRHHRAGVFKYSHILDDCAIDCVRHMITKLKTTSIWKQDSRCVIYLATDKSSTYEVFDSFVQETGCSITYIRHRQNMSSNIMNLDDHHPWALSEQPYQDIHLLSYSHHFLGTQDSTLSKYVANLVASRSVQRSTHHIDDKESSVVSDIIDHVPTFHWVNLVNRNVCRCISDPIQQDNYVNVSPVYKACSKYKDIRFNATSQYCAYA